jgi:hypothetical protein
MAHQGCSRKFLIQPSGSADYENDFNKGKIIGACVGSTCPLRADFVAELG